MDWSFVLIFLATAVNGIIAGITLDKALVNLPARRRIGVVNYADSDSNYPLHLRLTAMK